MWKGSHVSQDGRFLPGPMALGEAFHYESRFLDSRP